MRERLTLLPAHTSNALGESNGSTSTDSEVTRGKPLRMTDTLRVMLASSTDWLRSCKSYTHAREKEGRGLKKTLLTEKDVRGSRSRRNGRRWTAQFHICDANQTSAALSISEATRHCWMSIRTEACERGDRVCLGRGKGC